MIDRVSRQPLLYRRATTAGLLDVSISSVKRLEQDGKLDRIRRRKIVFHRAEQVHQLAQQSDADHEYQAPQPPTRKAAKPVGRSKPDAVKSASVRPRKQRRGRS